MAFMMPVVKKNYSLYSSSPGSGGPEQRPRKTSEKSDGREQQKSGRGRGGTGLGRRKAKSESQSLSTSPGDVHSSDGVTQRTKPVGISQHPRGSAPILVRGTLHSSSFQNSSHVPKKGTARPSTSAPTGNSPVHSKMVNGSSEFTRSSISSSSSSSDSTTTGKKFHSKLVMRLRKTFRIKDPEPSNT